MSEAQQYQEIRRFWKKQYRWHQRAQSLLTYSSNEESQPPHNHLGTIKNRATKAALISEAKRNQALAGKYAILLNKFKVVKK